MMEIVKKNWFMLGLVGTAILVIIDSTGIFVNPGVWLKLHHGPDAVIVLIFFLSGLALDTRQIREGLADIKGTLLALLLIFIAAPVIAILFSFLPLDAGLLLGLLLVSAMPTTLSSGVVMTGSAGGNMAHSLLITILANGLAVVTIPITLSLLLGITGEIRTIEIDQLPIMIKIATLVLLPLSLGISTRRILGSKLGSLLPYTSTCNQLGILTMVWMALCGSRPTIIAGISSIFGVLILVFLFHLLLLLTALYLTYVFKIPKKRRESVIFMGGQKTLPLSVILQVTLFPQYGIALVVCVMHHIVHLVMDAYLIKYLKNRG
jgi:sodium/bile acid cotransporter 7